MRYLEISSSPTSLIHVARYCCFAFDGSAKASLYTGGAVRGLAVKVEILSVRLSEAVNAEVQTQRLDVDFDLGRRFDWLICLEEGAGHSVPAV